MSLLAKLLADVGVGPDEPRNTVAGKFLSQEGVWAGPELLRIQQLERWNWRDAQDLDELVDEMTRRFLKPGGAGRLLPMQAVGLYSYIVYGKLCNVANVGSGKTLLSALIPTAGENVRPLHITYAKLQHKTIREFRLLAENWRVHQSFKFISFEKLSTAGAANFLTDYDPDVVVCDEVHAMKSPRSGRTKRMKRFLKGKPSCKFVPLTGTPGDDSVQNIAHIQDWVHGESSPVPRTYNELTQWCQALDPVVTLRRAPGALTDFVADGDHTLAGIRRAVGLRIEQTPGNVFHRTSEEVSCSLYLDAVTIDLPEQVERAFEHVRKFETAPDGREFVDIQIHNALATMSLGFYRVFEEIPPKQWSEARREWRRFVADICSQSKYALDTPDQVVRLVLNGEIDAGEVYSNWRMIEPTFTSRTITEWISFETANFAKKWLHEHESPVWSPYPEFSRKVAEESNRLFFWRQGLAGKLSIEDYDGKQGCVLSTQSNYLGRNLQDRWSKFLVFAPPGKSDILEQLIGRFHRQGQRAEQVEGTFFLGSIETYEALQRARERAKFDRDNNRNESCKLLSCDWLVPDWAEVSSWKGQRWKK